MGLVISCKARDSNCQLLVEQHWCKMKNICPCLISLRFGLLPADLAYLNLGMDLAIRKMISQAYSISPITSSSKYDRLLVSVVILLSSPTDPGTGHLLLLTFRCLSLVRFCVMSQQIFHDGTRVSPISKSITLDKMVFSLLAGPLQKKNSCL